MVQWRHPPRGLMARAGQGDEEADDDDTELRGETLLMRQPRSIFGEPCVYYTRLLRGKGTLKVGLPAGRDHTTHTVFLCVSKHENRAGRSHNSPFSPAPHASAPDRGQGLHTHRHSCLKVIFIEHTRSPLLSKRHTSQHAAPTQTHYGSSYGRATVERSADSLP